MRVAFFGSGSPFSLTVFRALAAQHEIAAVVVPDEKSWRARTARLLRPSLENPLARAGNELGLPVLRHRPGRSDRLVAPVKRRRPEIAAVASFPHLLSEPLINAATRGGVNLHTSLLPRHRGPDPLFWAYHADDRETGNSVHWMDAGYDTGDVISQERVPMARGRSIVDLYHELARSAAAQLLGVLEAIQAGTATRTAQDGLAATREPAVSRADWRVEFDRWPAERTWHFVSGIAELYGRLCRDPRGHPLPMGRARGFCVEAHGRPPGTWETGADGLRLYGPDGVVEVDIKQPPHPLEVAGRTR